MKQYKLALGLFLLFLLTVFPFRVDAVVKVPRLVSHGMVLQRDMPLKIWGWGGVQIAGEDARFVWANAVVLSENTLKVWSRSISNPAAVRYAWDDNPADANLKNKEGLPASPFTTEN